MSHAPCHDNAPQPCESGARAQRALEDIRLYAARHRKEEWARTILRFCAEGGAVGSVLREAAPASKEAA